MHKNANICPSKWRWILTAPPLWQTTHAWWFVVHPYLVGASIRSCIEMKQNISMGGVLYSTKWVKQYPIARATTQNTTNTNNKQHEPPPPYPLPALLSITMATSTKAPTFGSMAPYGFISGARYQACYCNCQFPCLGRQNRTHEKIERYPCLWP